MTATKGPGFQSIGGIPDRAPTPSLLTSARRIPAGVNWHSGVSWRSTQALQSFRRAYCAAGDNEAMPDISRPEFYPYWIYTPYTCDWVSEKDLPDENGGTTTVRNYEQDALDALEAMTAWNVSRELWLGDTETLNPSLVNTATDVSAASAVHPVAALGILLAAYADCTQAGGAVVHAPLQVVTSLIANYVVSQQGDVYYGPGGSIISPGPGYPTGNNTGPDGGDGFWLYVSGPVEYALDTPALFPPGEEAFYNRRENRMEITAQRLALARFDTDCVFAAEVYIPSPPDTEGAV